MSSRQVFVTGCGCICAAGGTTDATLEALYAGRRSPVPPRLIHSEAVRFPVFEVADVPAAASEGLAAPTRTTRLALAAVHEACAQARLTRVDLQRLRVGVALGTTVGCTLNNEPFYRAWKRGEGPAVVAVETYLANNPALYTARALGLEGPVATVANACSSGADAIGLGRSWLQAGLCDVVLAGGADELSRVTYLGFASLMITSDEPCRPFDRRRKGLNLGEGAGAVVLECAESARARQASLQARLAAYACACDAHHPTAPHPEGRGLRRAVAQALAEAQIAPRDIAFVNAHGTATPDNDRVEGAVLADLLAPATPIVSTKAYTGHTLGAAGGIEAVLTVRGLLDGRVPATAGFEEPDAECRITPTTNLTETRGAAAISTSLAFGGTNSVLVFCKANKGAAG